MTLKGVQEVLVPLERIKMYAMSKKWKNVLFLKVFDQKKKNSSNITKLTFALDHQLKNLKDTISQNFLGMLRW